MALADPRQAQGAAPEPARVEKAPERLDWDRAVVAPEPGRIRSVVARRPAHRELAWLAASGVPNRSRRTNFCGLPLAVRGSASTKRTVEGFL